MKVFTKHFLNNPHKYTQNAIIQTDYKENHLFLISKWIRKEFTRRKPRSCQVLFF